MKIEDVAVKLLESGSLDQATLAARAQLRELTCRDLRDLTKLRPQAFADLLAQICGLPRADLPTLRSGEAAADGYSHTFLRQRSIYPYKDTGGCYRIALADPSELESSVALALPMASPPVFEIATFEDVALALDGITRLGESDRPSGHSQPDVESTEALRDLASGAPVVSALASLFERAAGFRATDIHIEPQRREVVVRLRVDGVLRAVPLSNPVSGRALISRLKILAGLNIAEQRLPQDGRFQIEAGGRTFDVRLATMPTTTGEAAILRLLQRGTRLVQFADLGLNDRDASRLRTRILEPNGLVIVTGPTGSGKTTTLAACLDALNDPSRKILTIEDPVEYEIDGIQQSQVRPAVGLTFPSALRAFLRQDPDVIMIGEIRDAETARIAIQAALTGHLVLTTLHTNSAASAITRLADIGIERYLIASTLTAVVSQRLVRTLCEHCRRLVRIETSKSRDDPRYVALEILPGTELYEPEGCESCGYTGYRGRHAIFEVIDVDAQVRSRILSGADDREIDQVARAGGMTSLMEDGLKRCHAGSTSVDEVFRVAAIR
jgi:general secretion pathway protein E